MSGGWPSPDDAGLLGLGGIFISIAGCNLVPSGGPETGEHRPDTGSSGGSLSTWGGQRGCWGTVPVALVCLCDCCGMVGGLLVTMVRMLCQQCFMPPSWVCLAECAIHRMCDVIKHGFHLGWNASVVVQCGSIECFNQTGEGCTHFMILKWASVPAHSIVFVSTLHSHWCSLMYMCSYMCSVFKLILCVCRLVLLMEPLASLESERDRLRLRAASLRKQIKSAQSAARRQRLAAVGEKAVTPFMKGVSLRLLLIADGNCGLAVQYLRMKGRQASEADINAWHAELGPHDRERLLRPPVADKTSVRQLAEAQKFAKEARLVQWVDDQNQSKGLAPTSSLILEHSGGLVLSRNPKNKFRWLRKCMHRFGCRRSRFAHGEQLSDEDFRSKAGMLICLQVLISKHGQLMLFAGLVLVPVFGPNFGDALIPFIHFYYVGPQIGPQNGFRFWPQFLARRIINLEVICIEW